MRHVVVAAVALLTCTGMSAQTPDPQTVLRHATMVENQLRILEREVGLISHGLRRDAFIVVQLSASARELSDFQRNVAIQKALDRVRDAERRATEKPRAAEPTTRLLRRLAESLEKARSRGLSADLSSIRQELSGGASQTQRKIFRDLNDVRRIRQLYGDLQSRTGNTIIDFDEALEEALAAAFGLLDQESRE